MSAGGAKLPGDAPEEPRIRLGEVDDGIGNNHICSYYRHLGD